MQSNFIDYVKISCSSGNGGAGSSHLRREKYIPKGGPDGGDGGKGGDIILKVNRHMWTLLPLKYNRHFKAEDGKAGGKEQLTGANGKNIYIEVPLGTVIKNESGEFIGELVDQEEFILLKGGKGGLGNSHFKSSTNQTPRYAQPGLKGEHIDIILELKLLADIGLVGFPNVGKSTLLAALTAAKPKIADYSFTTLTPNLGIVKYRDFRSFVLADIPGIIEGASEGKGLGHRFLRHIERNSALLFLISSESENHYKEYKILDEELRKYNLELADKERLIAISKSDLIDNDSRKKILNSFSKEEKPIFISSINNEGLIELKDKLWFLLQKER